MLYDYALRFVGVPYLWGGTNPMTGMDCSSLVRLLLHSEGVRTSPPENSQGLYAAFSSREIAIPHLGALVFYGQDSAHIDHVGLCLNQFQHIEAAGGDHTTTTFQRAIEQNAFVRVTPIRQTNRVAIVMPPYPFPVT